MPCITTGDIPDGDCSDLLMLASADLLLCSTSTYSSLAAFLSDAPYLWFAPNLHGNAQARWLGERSDEMQRPGSPLRVALDSHPDTPSLWREASPSIWTHTCLNGFRRFCSSGSRSSAGRPIWCAAARRYPRRVVIFETGRSAPLPRGAAARLVLELHSRCAQLLTHAIGRGKVACVASEATRFDERLDLRLG